MYIYICVCTKKNVLPSKYLYNSLRQRNHIFLNRNLVVGIEKVIPNKS